MFGIKGRQPTQEERKEISEYKKMIFEGFKAALKKGVPQEIAGLLVDEEFGSTILREAKKNALTFAMPVEKSGQDEFDFEYGEKYPLHIDQFDPTLVKVLVRYNPEGDSVMNKRQLVRLRGLSDFLQSIRKPFLFELIVPATKEQLSKLGEAKEIYDRELRPKLMVEAIKQIQSGGVEPTIWKLEGLEKVEDAKAVVKAAQRDGRKAAVITLGRGENKEKVQEWLKVGAKIPGIIGFAVGRTIFWEPLAELKAGKTRKGEAIDGVARNYADFANLWTKERKNM
jgi:5-dehydro-2-deoxygluconokinase